MGANSTIEWCDHTFNPWVGCQKVSPACDGCFAEHLMDTRHHRVIWGQRKTETTEASVGTRSRTSAGYWRQPIKWNMDAAAAGTRPRVFPSLCDPFDNQVPPEWRADLFELIAATPHLIWLLLTKRPQNIVAMVHSSGAIAGNGTRYLPRNAALGTTCEDQERADRNLTELLRAAVETGPAFTFGSFEPLLGPIDISLYLRTVPALNWAIAGGETDQGKHKARPSQVAWFRSLRDQCKATGTEFHFKQWGEYGPSTSGCYSPDPDFVPVERFGKKVTGRILDNREHNGFPELVRA